ncbi:DUF2726 domain-containing protein [Aliidiomarina celeris]|uniref:DUF2726 domain-containing protein n=1 Tax=Aliidiomarina celeris TaxID=2249428 RepID=UPI001E3EE9B7|nr:DUF2726 domain-containing protein [Aliidiomarina celeris]
MCQNPDIEVMVMEYLLILFIVALVTVAILAARVSETFAPYPYKKRQESFFSATEESFMSLLERGCGERYRVFTKVRLGDVITVRSDGLSSTAKRDAANKLNSRLLDFVLCDRTTMKVAAVIELEPVEPSNVQMKRNWFLKNSLSAAGVPFLRFKARPGYRADELGEFIQTKLRQSEYVRAAGPKQRHSESDAAAAA